MKITLIVSLFTAFILSQSSPKTSAYGKVSYNMFTHLRVLQLEQPAVLYFTKDISVFIHSKGQEGFQQANSVSESNSKSNTIIDGWYQDTVGCVYYKHLKKKKLVIREFALDQPYLTEEPSLPTINWNILSETKRIGNFICEKATTKFRGRQYTAWFTADIPISNGPWKFHGLPGLILEVYDSTGEVKFTATEIEIPVSEVYPIYPPASGKKVDFKIFKKAEDIEFEKMRKRILSQQDDRNGKMEITKNKIKHIEMNYEW